MSATTALPFRPLRLVELLDQAFSLYRRNFLKLTAIAAAPMIPLVLLMTVPLALFVPFFLQDPLRDRGWQVPLPVGIFSFLVGAAIAFITAIVGGILMQSAAPAAIAQAVTDVYLGKQVSIISSYREIKPHWQRLLGAVGLLLMVAMSISLAFGALFSILPCLPLLLTPVQYSATTLIQGMILPLVPPVVVVERRDVWHSIRRAWELARWRFWRMFGFRTLLLVLNIVVTIGPTLLVVIVLQFIAGPFVEISNPSLLPILMLVVATLATVILQLFCLSFQWTSISLMYFDLRIRFEGLDLAMQAASTAEEINLNDILTQAPPFEKTSLITWREVGYLAIISIGIATTTYVIPILLAVAAAIFIGRL